MINITNAALCCVVFKSCHFYTTNKNTCYCQNSNTTIKRCLFIKAQLFRSSYKIAKCVCESLIPELRCQHQFIYFYFNPFLISVTKLNTVSACHSWKTLEEVHTNITYISSLYETSVFLCEVKNVDE